MSIVAEDGSGVAGAETYASVAFADAYWGARTHSSFSTTWLAVSSTTAKKEGSLREAAAFLDATYGKFYRGVRAGYVQGLLWPRTDALDDAGYELPGLPAELQAAVCELAARAISSALAEDQARGGRVKRERVEGAVEVEYFDGAPSETSYGVVAGILGPILTGAQGGVPQWHWR